VFQHFLTSLVPSQLLSPSGRIKVQLLPNRRQLNEEVVGGEFGGSRLDLRALADLVENWRNGSDRLRRSNPQDRMSALGQKQTSQQVSRMSALPPESGH